MAKTTFGILKEALRCYVAGDNNRALIDLKSLLNRERDCWTGYLIRGKVNAALHRYYEAISDYALVLEMSENLNERNRRMLLQGMALCATRLTAVQKEDLKRYFNIGPAIFPKTPPKPTPGRIAHIGKFLMDARDQEKVERFIANSVTAGANPHVLTLDVVTRLRALLKKADRNVGVVGSCIIGRDGMLRVSSLPAEYDAEAIGTCALAVCLASANASKSIDGSTVAQIIVRSGKGHMIIVESGELILICLTTDQQPEHLARLVKKVVGLNL